jgi:hypothetical protein
VWSFSRSLGQYASRESSRGKRTRAGVSFVAAVAGLRPSSAPFDVHSALAGLGVSLFADWSAVRATAIAPFSLIVDNPVPVFAYKEEVEGDELGGALVEHPRSANCAETHEISRHPLSNSSASSSSIQMQHLPV